MEWKNVLTFQLKCFLAVSVAAAELCFHKRAMYIF